MTWNFAGYFFKVIFLSKNRQRLLILAVVGLFISSFALIFLQSTMGGLQHKLTHRSKSVSGVAALELNTEFRDFSDQLLMFLTDIKNDEQQFVPEYEIELLMRSGGYISPVIVHAMDFKFARPEFLEFALNPVDEKGHLADLIVGADLAFKMRLNRGSDVQLISAAHTDLVFLGEVPRQVSVNVQEMISTDVPEVDTLHAWVRLSLIQNLIRAKEINRVRLYGPWDLSSLRSQLEKKFPTQMRESSLKLLSWEDQNQTLVWALRLETTVMVFLFVCMTMLVSLCITSGLMIFFNKVRSDLASFWIMGSSRKNLDKGSAFFLVSLSFISVASGLLMGLAALYVLDQYGGNIMPAGFVDRKIPVLVDATGLLVSFFVPFTISIVFSFFSLIHFRKDNQFIDIVRSVG